ncbi:MAG: hypothetical protein OXC03_08120 [Flavobacteriaceae bacterium]|nr:hypothetical protein [Flavobacteriaceae bacterium]
MKKFLCFGLLLLLFNQCIYMMFPKDFEVKVEFDEEFAEENLHEHEEINSDYEQDIDSLIIK